MFNYYIFLKGSNNDAYEQKVTELYKAPMQISKSQEQ